MRLRHWPARRSELDWAPETSAFWSMRDFQRAGVILNAKSVRAGVCDRDHGLAGGAGLGAPRPRVSGASESDRPGQTGGVSLPNGLGPSWRSLELPASATTTQAPPVAVTATGR
jgi:hypothetical protein